MRIAERVTFKDLRIVLEDDERARWAFGTF
jgi:hypothetical protein